MRPFFCRQGSKRKYSKALVSLFPEHQTYVEPFLGGGAVFWEKPPSTKEVLNDLDPVLVADYRRILAAPSDPSKYPILTTASAQNEFLRKSHSGKAEQVVESLLRRCNGFGGVYIEKGGTREVYTDNRKGRVSKVTTHEDKLKKIAEYKKRLSNASLTQQSYEKVLAAHDSPSTFFFMDPPYEKSVGLDYAEGSDTFPFAKFADDVRKLKGKFLVTINDSRAIRKLFQGLNIYPYVVKGHHAKSAIGKNDRKELLITNYPLHRQWKSRMTKGVLTGGKFHCEDEEELEGRGRGDGDFEVIFKAAKKAIDVDKWKQANAGCGVFGLYVLREYLNYPINIRELKKEVNLEMDRPGVLPLDKITPFLAKADIVSGEIEPHHPVIVAAPNGVKGQAVFALVQEWDELLEQEVRQDGNALLVVTYIPIGQLPDGTPIVDGHLSAVLPRKTGAVGAGANPYDAVEFDCQTPGPVPLPPVFAPGVMSRVVMVFVIKSEPRSIGKGLTHKESVLSKLNLPDTGHSLDELAKASGVPLSILQQVYNRGIGAYKTNPESVRMKGTYEKGVKAPMSQKLSKEQWAMARIYSFLDGNEKHDQDLRGKGHPTDFLPTLQHRFDLTKEQLDKVAATRDHLKALRLARKLGKEVTRPLSDVRALNHTYWGPGSCSVLALAALEVAMGHIMGVADAAEMSLEQYGLDGEQTRQVLREAGHRVEYVTGSDLELKRALADAMDKGQMGILHYLADYETGEGHAVAFLEEQGGDWVLVDCDEGVQPLTMKTVDSFGDLMSLTVVADRQGGIKRQTRRRLREIEKVQESSEGTSSFNTLVANIRRRATFLSKPDTFTEEDLEVLGESLSDLVALLDSAEDYLRTENNREVAIDEVEEAADALVEAIDDVSARIKRMKVQESTPTPPVSPTGKGKSSFAQQLKGIGYAPATYLADVRKKAKEAGYDPKAVDFANDGEHKLVVHTPDGRTVKFGRVGYGDFLIWTHMEKRGSAPAGVAQTKRKVFRVSHSAIRGRWRSDRFSPNNLALALLW